MPGHYNNDWPSDHFAVISEFVINFKVEKKKDKTNEEGEEMEEKTNYYYEKNNENNSDSALTLINSPEMTNFS